MKAYSLDLRERVLRDCDGGSGTRAVATKYRVSESWVRRLKQTRRQTGRVGPADRKPSPPAWKAQEAAIREAVRTHPDATLAEYRATHGVPLPVPTLARALAALALTRKKSR